VIHLTVEGQVPYENDPRYVTDTFREEDVEFLHPVHNYNNTTIMVRIGNSAVLVQLDELVNILRGLEVLLRRVDGR